MQTSHASANCALKGVPRSGSLAAMLDDRSYMRASEFDPRRSATMVLLVTLIVAFVVEQCVRFYGHVRTERLFALSLEGLRSGAFWQVFTFQFLHAGLLHLLFNCLGLYFFGRTVEEAIGTKRFLVLYFLAGTFGGALQIATTWLPGHPDLYTVGASAGVLGLLGAFARLFPMREIYLYFFPIRAQYVLWFFAFLSLFGTLVPFGTTAHAAHLGGLIVGVAFVRWAESPQAFFDNPFKSRQRKRQLVQAASKAVRWRPRPSPDPELPSEEFISREVDPILDKISAHGIQSLTDREKQILEAARAKMAKR